MCKATLKTFLLGLSLVIASRAGGVNTKDTKDLMAPRLTQKSALRKNNASEGGKTKRDELKIFICSANVFMHNGYRGKKIDGSNLPKDELSKKIIELIMNKAGNDNDVVIVGFQELREGRQEVHNQLREMGAVLAESWDSQGFTNTIAVISKHAKTKKHVCSQIDFKQTYRSGRSASLISFPDLGLTIANTHLFGGKYDDIDFHKYQNSRGDMLMHIVEKNPLKQTPHIVMGDFNSDTKNDSASTKGYWENILEDKTPKDKNLSFKHVKKFLASGHDYLNEQGYVSLIERDTMQPTTPFGVVCDWIYFKKQSLKDYKVLESGACNAMEMGLSDHNFPWVRISVGT